MRIAPCPDRHDFLNAIRADPDADPPRLIYADWLDENGESDRAEFVRFGVAAGIPLSSQLSSAAARRFGLDFGELRRGRHFWPDGVGPFARGFITSIAAPRRQRDFETVLNLIRTEPIVRCDIVRRTWGDLGEFTTFAGDRLRTIRILRIDTNVVMFEGMADQLGPLADCPEVEFENSLPLSIDLPNQFRLPPTMRRVELSLRDDRDPGVLGTTLNIIGDRSVRALELYDAGALAEEAIEAVIRWPGAAQLETLALGGGGHVPADRLTALAAATPRLRRLEVTIGLHGRSPAELASAWPDLRALTLSRSEDPKVGLGIVSQLAPYLDELTMCARRSLQKRSRWLVSQQFEPEIRPPIPDWRGLLRILAGHDNLSVLDLWPCSGQTLLDIVAGGLNGLEVLRLSGGDVHQGRMAVSGVKPTHLDALAQSLGGRLRALLLDEFTGTNATHEYAMRLFGPKSDLYWQQG